MRNRYLVLLALLVSASLIYGCKKSGKDNTIVTFVNRLDKAVTLDIYGSQDDYFSNSGLVSREAVEAGQTLELPGSTFIGDKAYFIDWYSEDYYYNNWFNDDYPISGERVRIKPEEGNNTYYFDPGMKGQSRETFIQGDGLKTSWIAVGAYLYSTSTGYTNEWNTITKNERFRQVTVNKNFTADYIRRNSSGESVTEVLPFIVQQTEVPYIEFKTADGGVGGNMTGGKHPYAPPPSYATNSTDTIMALFPDIDYIFMMVRQQ